MTDHQHPSQTRMSQEFPSGPRRPFFGGATTPPHIATLIVLAGVAAMSMNVFLPMLPQIARDLNTTPAKAQLVLTIFLAATGVAQLFIGPLSDRFGRRPVMIGSLVVFITGTGVCILATSIEMLIAGRILQATSAAFIALSRAVVRDLFDTRRAASIIGYVTMAMALIPMVSPSLGGWVGEIFGWRAPFVLLLFVGCGLLILVHLDLGETHPPKHNPVMEQVRENLVLLREPRFWGYVLSATFGAGAYFAFLGGAPFVGIEVVGLSPTQLGFYFAAVAIGYMSGNFISGRFSERIGIEPMMLYGGLVACFGVGLAFWLMTTFEPHGAYLFFPMAFVGMGNGMTLPNANAGAISVRPELAGSASGIAGFVQVGGGAMLATLSGALISLENQALPLYMIMFVSSLMGAAVALAMYRHAKSQ